jgi:hypothetical protein
MQSRPVTYSAEEHLEDLAYLIAHLQPDPVGAQFVPDAEAAYAALEAKRADWSIQERAVAAAQAGIVIAKGNLSDAVRTARQGVLEDVRHDHHSRKMLIYFPHGLSALISAPFLDEVNAVRMLAGNLATDQSPAVQALSAPLVAAADAAQAAFDLRQQALVAEGTAYGHLQVEKVNATDAIRRIAHRLLEVLANDRDKVNGFFRVVVRPSRGNADRSDDGATPAVAAPGTAAPEAPELPEAAA